MERTQCCGTCRWHDVDGFYALYGKNADGMGDIGFCRQRPPLPDMTRCPFHKSCTSTLWVKNVYNGGEVHVWLRQPFCPMRT